MLITKICKRCGVEFDGYGRACYCKDCKRQVMNDYQRGYRERNREKCRKYIREYMRDYSKGIKRCTNTK